MTPDKCDECGQKKHGTEERIDPYQEQVNKKKVKRVLCDRCHLQLTEDV